MIFDIVSGLVFGGIGGTVLYHKNGGGNDNKKIENICANCGLFKKDDNGNKKYIRIHRKSKIYNGMEYVYQIPQGMSFKDFQSKIDYIQDGLNIKKTIPDFSIQDFLQLKFNKNIFKQIEQLLEKKRKIQKKVELEWDGMLRVKVYDQDIQKEYVLTKEMMKNLKKWEVPLGVSLSGVIKIDFDVASHVLVGGATDMGKSNILKLIVTVITNNNPEDVSFTLIDLKGGLEFSRYEDMKQVKNFATNVDESLTALEDVQKEMNDIFQFLRKNHFDNVKKAKYKKRHFIIIDEAAELSIKNEIDNDVKKTKIQCDNIIKDIARRGRASGMKLLYCTQYPTAEVINSQIKRNLLARICLPVDTDTASEVVLDEAGAEKLPLVQGRCFYKRHRKVEMQSYLVEDSLINEVITPHINIRSGLSHEHKDNGDEGRKDRQHFTLTKIT